MTSSALKIEKKRQPVTLWVHPEGQVHGTIFLRPNGGGDGGEPPLAVLNDDSPFLVMHTDEPGEVRFYNKRSIIRVEYEPEDGLQVDADDVTVIACSLHMMDGSLFEGTIREVLPPEHQRLYDYLNQGGAAFLRIFLDDGSLALVNKAYIVRVTDLGEAD